ncbi:MAG: ATP-dependent sacrificial sulfur transferase LarE [Gemmatimonadaceae bacterium]
MAPSMPPAVAVEADLDTSVDAAGDVRAKEDALVSWLRARERVAIGFSGGVDSAYLACVAVDALGAANVLAIIGRSPSYPAAQWAAARAVADRFAIPILELDTNEMEDPRYAANPSNRCYFCKSELWSLLVPAATARGITTVADGTNADDVTGHRPGAVAASEHAVASPLLIVGLTKAEIRSLSQARGIPTWSQPSSPCLSSRIPYGVAVTATRLAMIERAEAALRELGIDGDLRVRYHGDLARVEIGAESIETWLAPEASERVASAVRGAGFERVSVDLRGFRSGSLNILTGVSAA